MKLTVVTKMSIIAGLICLLLYLRTLACGFCLNDDHVYIINNPAIRSLDLNLLNWAFTTTYAGWWMPLTWLSLALDYHFWQVNPLGYHLTNAVLHAVNAGLVVMIAALFLASSDSPAVTSGSRSFLYPGTLLLAGLLFGLHPLRVESVAWVTERKDVLNGVFSLGGLVFYLRHGLQQQSMPLGSLTPNYLAALCCMVLSLMAKPVSVVLPLMLLVLDWYPLGRLRSVGLRRVLLEKLPFLAVATLFSVATLYSAAQNKILQTTDFLTIGQRFLVSGNAVFEYIRLLLIPVGINPAEQIILPLSPANWFKSGVVVVACVLMYRFRQRQLLAVASICFLLPLLPVLALFQNGDQALAARFTYLPSVIPSIAAAIIAAAAHANAMEKEANQWRRALPGLAAASLMVLAVMTWYQIRFWDNGEIFLSRIVAMQPTDKHYFQRAEYREKNGHFASAIEDYTAALERATGDMLRYRYNIYAFRGEAHLQLGQYSEAIRDFDTAIQLYPHRSYYHRRGTALRHLGQEGKAAEDLQVAGEASGKIEYWIQEPDLPEIERLLQANCNNAGALYKRGMAAYRSKEYDRAVTDLSKAVSLDPDNKEFFLGRGLVYREKGELERALSDYNEALRLDPGRMEIYLNRAEIFAEHGDYGRAIADLDSLLRLDPTNFVGYANRGVAQYRLRRLEAAIRDFDAALALNPASSLVLYNRGLALEAIGNKKRADEDFLRAKQLGIGPGGHYP